jgi:hypothetical protein
MSSEFLTGFVYPLLAGLMLAIIHSLITKGLSSKLAQGSINLPLTRAFRLFIKLFITNVFAITYLLLVSTVLSYVYQLITAAEDTSTILMKSMVQHLPRIGAILLILVSILYFVSELSQYLILAHMQQPPLPFEVIVIDNHYYQDWITETGQSPLPFDKADHSPDSNQIVRADHPDTHPTT